MLAEVSGIEYGQTVDSLAASPMMPRPTPLAIDQWLKDIGRRALMMAEFAVHDRDVSQDLVQDSLLAFISRYADKPAEQWTPLFYTILRSQIMDWKRRQARRSKWLTWFSSHNRDDGDDEDEHPINAIATPTDENPATLLANANDIAIVQRILSRLPERQQQAFLLRAWEGLDISTTANIMDCGESSVKTHYSRALLALRLGLNEANQHSVGQTT